MASDICFVNICICKYISLKVFCRRITIQKGESLFFHKAAEYILAEVHTTTLHLVKSGA